MRYRQNAVLTSLRAAQQFLERNSEVLRAVNTSTRTQLDDVVDQLTELSIAQDAGTRGGKGETARQHALRVALRRYDMAPIAEVAKCKLREVPEFAALKMPPSNATTQRAVSAAYAMADAASAHAQVFIDSGLPTTFADDLRTAAAALRASVDDRSNQQGRRSGATAGLAAEEKRGRSILRILNVLIIARVRNDARLVAEWTAARVVQRKPGPTSGTHASDDATPIHSAPLTVTPTATSTSTPVTAPVTVAA